MLRDLLFSTRKVILVVEINFKKNAFYVLFSTIHVSLSTTRTGLQGLQGYEGYGACTNLQN